VGRKKKREEESASSLHHSRSNTSKLSWFEGGLRYVIDLPQYNGETYMSFPRKLKLFRAWARAMEEGATVDAPDYGKRTTTTSRTSKTRKRPK